MRKNQYQYDVYGYLDLIASWIFILKNSILLNNSKAIVDF